MWLMFPSCRAVPWRMASELNQVILLFGMGQVVKSMGKNLYVVMNFFCISSSHWTPPIYQRFQLDSPICPLVASTLGKKVLPCFISDPGASSPPCDLSSLIGSKKQKTLFFGFCHWKSKGVTFPQFSIL
jgi:hypothetical protein